MYGVRSSPALGYRLIFEERAKGVPPFSVQREAEGESKVQIYERAVKYRV